MVGGGGGGAVRVRRVGRRSGVGGGMVGGMGMVERVVERVGGVGGEEGGWCRCWVVFTPEGVHTRGCSHLRQSHVAGAIWIHFRRA